MAMLVQPRKLHTTDFVLAEVAECAIKFHAPVLFLPFADVCMFKTCGWKLFHAPARNIEELHGIFASYMVRKKKEDSQTVGVSPLC